MNATVKEKATLEEILERHRARKRLPVFSAIEAYFWSNPSMTADQCLQTFEETYLGIRLGRELENISFDHVALVAFSAAPSMPVFYVFLKDGADALAGMFPCDSCGDDYCLDHADPSQLDGVCLCCGTPKATAREARFVGSCVDCSEDVWTSSPRQTGWEASR
jgi:hypothetical protein